MNLADRPQFEIVAIDRSDVARYSTISPEFQVTSAYLITGEVAGSDWRQTEVQLEIPYWKNYDLLPGNDPLSWPAKYGCADWGFFLATTQDRIRGGAVVAPGGTSELIGMSFPQAAVLWDLRVDQRHRN